MNVLQITNQEERKERKVCAASPNGLRSCLGRREAPLSSVQRSQKPRRESGGLVIKTSHLLRVRGGFPRARARRVQKSKFFLELTIAQLSQACP